MQTHRLVPHPDHPPLAVRSISMRWVTLDDGRAMLRYRVDGAAEVVVPPFAGKGRGDELWQTTCFELFIGDATPAYREFNFSPSGRWAAYAFPGYRGERCDAQLALQPDVRVERGEDILVLTAWLASADLAGATRAGISAIIEERGGRKSYWALAHPDGSPDFHHPDCLALPIGPADAP